VLWSTAGLIYHSAVRLDSIARIDTRGLLITLYHPWVLSEAIIGSMPRVMAINRHNVRSLGSAAASITM
jgi:hypothetical protein